MSFTTKVLVPLVPLMVRSKIDTWPPVGMCIMPSGPNHWWVTLMLGLTATPVAVAITPAPQLMVWFTGLTLTKGTTVLTFTVVVAEDEQPVMGSVTVTVMSVAALVTVMLCVLAVKLLLDQ